MVHTIKGRNGESYGFQILHAHLWAQSEQKPIKNSGNVAVGVVRDSWVLKIFRAPMHRAHRAVIFAIAQLSCFTCSRVKEYTVRWHRIYPEENQLGSLLSGGLLSGIPPSPSVPAASDFHSHLLPQDFPFTPTHLQNSKLTRTYHKTFPAIRM